MGCNKIETKNQKASYDVVWIAVVEGSGDVANAKFVFLHLQRKHKLLLIEQSLKEIYRLFKVNGLGVCLLWERSGFEPISHKLVVETNGTSHYTWNDLSFPCRIKKTPVVNDIKLLKFCRVQHWSHHLDEQRVNWRIPVKLLRPGIQKHIKTLSDLPTRCFYSSRWTLLLNPFKPSFTFDNRGHDSIKTFLA